MILLKKKFPRKAGLQDTLLQQKKTIPYPWTHIHGNVIQIFLVNDNHWVCVERENNSIKLFDSMNKKTTKSAIHIIARYIASKENKINLQIMNVQQQSNSNDCGIYALAFTTSLLFCKCTTKFNYCSIRKHFIDSIVNPTIVSCRKNSI